MSGKDHNRAQQTFYERTAGRYDRSVWSLGCRANRNHEAKIRAVASAIAATDAGTILEVGAGTGLHARWLLDRTEASYVGLDLSAPMLRIASERLGGDGARARLVLGDATRLPFPDGRFDAAFCAGTLHHLGDPSAGLAELARVVRPGGRVAALEPNWKFPSVLVYSAITREERNTFKVGERPMLAWARAAGLADVRLERLLYTPPRPAGWGRAFDRVDAALGRTPLLRRLSINLLVAGTRP